MSAGSKSGDGTSGQFQVKGAVSPTNRDEIILRCKAKVATRSIPPPTEAQTDHGVPVFLNQLQEALRLGQITSPEIGRSAIKHGHDLLLQGFTVSHDARPSRQERDESRIVAPDGPDQVWRVGDESRIRLVPVGFKIPEQVRDTDFEIVGDGHLHCNVTHRHATKTVTGWAGPGHVPDGFAHNRRRE